MSSFAPHPALCPPHESAAKTGPPAHVVLRGDCNGSQDRPLTSALQLTMVRARVLLLVLPGSRLAVRRAYPSRTGSRDDPGPCPQRTRRVSRLRHRLASCLQPSRPRAPRPALAGSSRLAAASLPALPSGSLASHLHRTPRRRRRASCRRMDRMSTLHRCIGLAVSGETGPRLAEWLEDHEEVCGARDGARAGAVCWTGAPPREAARPCLSA